MATVDENLLDPARWPAISVPHRAYLEAAIPKLRADDRLVGLAAGGSFISRMLDEHSDLDLVVVSRPDAASEVLRDGPDLARKATLPSRDANACWSPLTATLALYVALRERAAPPTLQRRVEAERAVREFLASPRRPA